MSKIRNWSPGTYWTWCEEVKQGREGNKSTADVTPQSCFNIKYLSYSWKHTDSYQIGIHHLELQRHHWISSYFVFTHPLSKTSKALNTRLTAVFRIKPPLDQTAAPQICKLKSSALMLSSMHQLPFIFYVTKWITSKTKLQQVVDCLKNQAGRVRSEENF